MRKPPDDGDDVKRRRRRADDTARWRSRRIRGVELFSIEGGEFEKSLAIQLGELKANLVGDKDAVASALGRLLRRALIALLNAEARRRPKKV